MVTVGAALYLLNDASLAFNIGITLMVFKTVLYLVYEHIWDILLWR